MHLRDGTPYNNRVGMGNWIEPVYGTARRNEYDYAPLALGVLCLVTLALAVAIPRYYGITAEVAVNPTEDFAQIRQMLDRFRRDAGRYPSTEEGLQILVSPASEVSNWKGPYGQEIPNDPWGRPYLYECVTPEQPNGFTLISYGRDGQPGGDGEAADLVDGRALADMSH